jgi:hypothetical protein
VYHINHTCVSKFFFFVLWGQLTLSPIARGFDSTVSVCVYSVCAFLKFLYFLWVMFLLRRQGTIVVVVVAVVVG